MRVAIGQFTSSNQLEQNLARMRALTEEAARGGAEILAFPEMAYFMGPQIEWQPLIPRYSELLATFASWAKEFGLYFFPGSLREPSPSQGRYYNTLPALGTNGELLGAYRKIFLFRANLPDRVYSESLFCEAGKETLVTLGPGGVSIGSAICYDLRFPELFRTLRAKGAQLILLPASFTVPTGTAHWEILLRARAIENQVFVLAPGQTGIVGDGAKTYGHSLVIAPWGEKLAEKPEGEGLIFADLNLKQLSEAAARVDCWRSKRDDLFSLLSK